MAPASSVLCSCRPRFQAGKLLMTPSVRDLVEQGTINLKDYLRRHLDGDWGDVSPHDWQANQDALRHGDRLFSAYQVTPDLRLWIITEAGGEATTALLPGED